jgi:hypothetical protein
VLRRRQHCRKHHLTRLPEVQVVADDRLVMALGVALCGVGVGGVGRPTGLFFKFLDNEFQQFCNNMKEEVHRLGLLAIVW